MGARLDGQALFVGEVLEIRAGSFRRDFVERFVPGLDGVISIDMGGRGRQIKQRGVLRAKSYSQMQEMIAEISLFMDGNTHQLLGPDGEEFADVRMDSFEVGKVRTSGSGVVADYEIVYTQLGG